MDWKTCRELLLKNKEFYAYRHEWPEGIRIRYLDDEYLDIQFSNDFFSKLEDAFKTYDEKIHKDLSPSEDENNDWMVW